MDIHLMIAKKWPVMLATFLAVNALALSLIWLMPSYYEATATIFIARRGKFSAPATDVNELRAVSMIDRTIRKLGLKSANRAEPLTVDQFLECARVRSIKFTNMITVSYRSPDPVLAAKVANAWADLYASDVVVANRSDIESATQLVSKQIKIAQQNLQRAEDSLAAHDHPGDVERAKWLHEVEVSESAYTWIRQAYHRIPLEQYLLPTSLKVMDHAVPPTSPLQIRRNLLVVGSIVGGLILGMILATSAERMVTVKTLAEACQVSGLPAMGIIPWRFGWRESVPASLGRLDGDELCSNIEFFSAFGLKVFVVAAAGPTDAGAAYAMIAGTKLARLGHRVVVIDFDLYAPSLHALMLVSNRLGLSSVLSGRASVDDTLLKGTAGVPDVLVVGPTPPNAHVLIASDAWGDLLATIHPRYDFIFVVAPPVTETRDATLIAARADGLFVVIEAGRTRRFAVSHAQGELNDAGIKALGVFLALEPSVEDARNGLT